MHFRGPVPVPARPPPNQKRSRRSVQRQLALRLPLPRALCLPGCLDSAQAPSGRPASPVSRGERDGPLSPVDLEYICGNKFLATNQTRGVVGTPITWWAATRAEGAHPAASFHRHEGSSETEVETLERGAVELNQGYDSRHPPQQPRPGLRTGSLLRLLCGGGTSASIGEFSAPFSWNDIAGHMSLLPTGKFSPGLLRSTAAVGSCHRTVQGRARARHHLLLRTFLRCPMGGCW